MKNNNTGTSTILIVLITLAVIFIVCIIFGLFGFRITIDPLLELNWEATGVCLNAALIVISAISIIAAIKIPQIDRIEASKIELFKQRFELYYFLYKTVTDGNFPNNSSKEVIDEFNQVKTKLKYLVNTEDGEELEKISTHSPKMEHGSSEGNSHSFIITIDQHAPETLQKIFAKYLNLGNYGISEQ